MALQLCDCAAPGLSAGRSCCAYVLASTADLFSVLLYEQALATTPLTSDQDTVLQSVHTCGYYAIASTTLFRIHGAAHISINTAHVNDAAAFADRVVLGLSLINLLIGLLCTSLPMRAIWP